MTNDNNNNNNPKRRYFWTRDRDDPLFQPIEYREWIRQNVDNHHVVIEDVDIVNRVYDINGRDSAGTFKLIELKLKGNWLRPGQQRTYRLMNTCMKNGADIATSRYDGFYVVESTTYKWITENDKLEFWINKKPVTHEQMASFMEGAKIDGIEPLDSF